MELNQSQSKQEIANLDNLIKQMKSKFKQELTQIKQKESTQINLKQQ